MLQRSSLAAAAFQVPPPSPAQSKQCSRSMTTLLLDSWGVREELVNLRNSFLLGSWPMRDWIRLLSEQVHTAADLEHLQLSKLNR